MLSNEFLDLELSSQAVFNSMIKYMVQRNIEILDVDKGSVDVEAVYQEVYTKSDQVK